MRRRSLVLGTGAALLGAGGVARAAIPGLDPGLPAGTRAEAVLARLPGKQPLICLSDRPPNYESPLSVFGTTVTPNDAFFVRYHLAGVPTMDALRNWSLRVTGDAAGQPVQLSLADLRSMPAVELMAVCQCSGNRRGLVVPHVAGVEWGVGAMGNARWRGVRLRDVLTRAGIGKAAVEVAFSGADGPVLPATPHFAKSLPVERANDGEVMIAYEMNGAALPLLNGYPVRLVVPGWTGTYWMKHLDTLEIRSKPLDNFWMQKAYRVPAGMFPVAHPFASQDNAQTSPITEIVVNALVTNLTSGAQVAASGFTVQGIAWDSGSGIRTVELSTDAGASWRPATLGQDLGRYAFRPWNLRVKPAGPGPGSVMVRATSKSGAVQPAKLLWNAAGYQHNVIQTLAFTAA